MITGSRDRFRTVAGGVTGTDQAGKNLLAWTIQAMLAVYLLPVAAVVLAIGAVGMAFNTAARWLPPRRVVRRRRRQAARIHPHFTANGTTTPVSR